MTAFFNKFAQLSKNELVLLILSVSVFISVYLELVLLALLPVYITVTHQWFIFRARKRDMFFLAAFWLMSIVVTVYYGTVWDILLGVSILFAIVAMIFIAFAMTKRIFRFIISLCCIASIPCLLIALWQKHIGFRGPYGARYCSVFQNPNYYAAYLTFTILFCLYCFFKLKGPARFVFLGLIPLNIYALYLTECRTAIVVVLLSAGILLFAKSKFLGIAYYVLLATGVILCCCFYDSIPFIPRSDNIVHDITTRLDIWRGAAKSILDHPILGTGYNSYLRAAEVYGSLPRAHSHNLLLELVMDFGILGTVFLLGYFALNVGKIISLHRHHHCRYRYALTIAMLVTVFLHGMLDLTAFYPQTSLIIMYVVSFSTEYDKYKIFETPYSSLRFRS